MAKSKELKVETPVVETEKNTETKSAEKKTAETAAPAAKEKNAAASAKKTAAKTKKAAKEKTPVVPEVFVQYQEQQADTAAVVAKVKALYVSQKHRESSIKSLQIYIKPEDGKAYYVINDKIQGELDLF